jgi:integrase
MKLDEVVGRSIAMSRSDADAIAAKMPAGEAKDCFQVLRGTGMRPAETMSMRWEFLKLETGIYANPHGKTKSAKRPIPLLNGSLAVLQRRHMAQGFPAAGWIFPTKKAKTGHITNHHEGLQGGARGCRASRGDVYLYGPTRCAYRPCGHLIHG